MDAATIIEILQAGEDRLMERILAYARATGYSRYTSTLAEAWRASVQGITGSIVEALARDPRPPTHGPDSEGASAAAAIFGVEQARRHRDRGVTLPMFLGLMKYYRRAYLDHLDEAGLPASVLGAARQFVDAFFDVNELAYTEEWSATTPDAAFAGLQSTNRRMTNEKNRYLTIFETLPSPALLLTPEGRVENWNLAAARLFGRGEGPGAIYYASEPVERPLPEWFLARVQAHLAGDGKEVTWQEAFEVAGETRHFQVTFRRMQDVSAKFTGVVTIFTDITDVRRADAALAEAHARLAEWVAHLEQRNRDAQILREIGQMIDVCAKREEAYGVIASRAPQLFPRACCGAISLYNASRNLLESCASWGGTPSVSESVFGPEDCWALRLGRTHRVEDLRSGLACAHVRGGSARRTLCVPLVAHGEALGLLHLEGDAAVEAPRGEELGELERTAGTLADQLSLSLANLSLREALRTQSVRDPLTNLFNRRHMLESLERDLRRAERSGRSVGVLMLDLDHFKTLNDTFGHEAGDLVLRELGTLLLAQFRAADIVCRYGGEEFALVLSEAGELDLLRRAEQARESVRGMQIVYRGQLLPRITVSVGAALFPDHGSTTDGLIRAADAALYRAKREGRDRVVRAVAEPRRQEALAAE